MIILGLDTSGKIGSIALSNGIDPIAEISINIDSRCSERLLATIDYLISESGYSKEDIELLAFSAGPGSYTGLRIGLSTIKAIAYVNNINIVSVSTLEALASRIICTETPIVPLINAHTSLVYSAIFYDNSQILKPGARKLDHFLTDLNEERYIFTGIDAYKFADKISSNLGERALFAKKHLCIPSALSVIDIALSKAEKGDFVDIDSFIPEYLRDFAPKIKKGT